MRIVWDEPKRRADIVDHAGDQLLSVVARRLDRVMAALAMSGLAASRLELKLTESVLLDNKGYHGETTRCLGHAGVTMVMDDFGTGYSSINYLTNFAFGKIKTDRSFVQGMAERRELEAIVVSALVLGGSACRPSQKASKPPSGWRWFVPPASPTARAACLVARRAICRPVLCNCNALNTAATTRLPRRHVAGSRRGGGQGVALRRALSATTCSLQAQAHRADA